MGKGSGKTPARVVQVINDEVAKIGQNATSRAIGIPLYSIQKYMAGIAEPTNTTLEKLADYFERPVEWLRGKDVQDFWGQVYGDNLTEEEVEDLKHTFWSNRVEHAIHSPILIEVVKCLTKVPSGARAAAFAIIRNSCRYIESLSEEELVKVGNDLLKKIQETFECPPESKTAE